MTCEEVNKTKKEKNGEKHGRWGRKGSINWLCKLSGD